MTSAYTTLDKLGRVVIPAECRRHLGLKPGDKLHVVVEDGDLRLVTLRGSIRRIQEAFNPYRPKGGVLRSVELIKERREQAARE
jgi:AbrB family looped-hinge helix DNA binding protein